MEKIQKAISLSLLPYVVTYQFAWQVFDAAWYGLETVLIECGVDL